mmetsp:Transcript_71972/g.192231  ORF Transcript_71972/g.192231 Transcript_71972/m.192231 type:complete len:80 (+) Transcript_71972:2425-2664(+)
MQHPTRKRQRTLRKNRIFFQLMPSKIGVSKNKLETVLQLAQDILGGNEGSLEGVRRWRVGGASRAAICELCPCSRAVSA